MTWFVVLLSYFPSFWFAISVHLPLALLNNKQLALLLFLKCQPFVMTNCLNNSSCITFSSYWWRYYWAIFLLLPFCVHKYGHRLARLLKQQLSIIIYSLSTKENKLLFSVSVCSKQTELCLFSFVFAANKRKLPFSISSVYYIYLCGCFNIYILPFQMKNGKQKPRQFFLIRLPFPYRSNGSLLFVHLLTKKETEVIRFQIPDEVD